MKPSMAGVLLGIFLGLNMLMANLAGSAISAASSRAGVSTTTKNILRWTAIDGTEYAGSDEIAAYLGMKISWLEPNRKMTMSGKTAVIQIERDRIESVVNGLGVRLGNAPIFREGKLYISRIDLEHSLLPRIRPEIMGAAPTHPKIIAIDAGHGGKDNGMENSSLGLKEKVLNLDVVMRLKKLCEAAGFKTVLTRTGDIAPINEELPMRAKIVNAAHADLLVSIHFNSLYPDTKTTGTESYVYTPQFQRSSGALSTGSNDARKNAVVVNRWDPWSSLLCDRIQHEVLASLKTVDRGQKTGHLLVLQDANCPAVLVESAFLSNDAEGRRVATPEFRQEIAAAIFAGIQNYVATLDEARTRISVEGR